MNQQHQTKFSWYKLLGALAIFSGTIGTIESRPANAIVSNTQDSLESTQSILEDSLERPTGATELNYSSLDKNTAQPIAKFRRRHGRRGFNSHRRGSHFGHGRRGFDGHRRGSRFGHGRRGFDGHRRGSRFGHGRRGSSGHRRGHHRGFRISF